MSTPERQPTPPIDSISGKHIDIRLVDPDHIRSYLESAKGHKGLYFGTEDDLPSPLTAARLDYWKSSHPEEVNIHASIDFDSEHTEIMNGHSWHEITSSAIKDRLLEETDEELYELPHELFTFYIPIDVNYAARVELDTDTHKCSVFMNVEKMHELEIALDRQLDIEPLGETNHYELFRRFSYVWSVTIDCVADIYGDTHDPSHKKRQDITICAPNPVVPQPPRLELEARKPETTIPDIEQIASDETTFESIGGLTTAKQRLEEIAIGFKHPELARAYGVSGRHFMLYGPAGTGKTSLVEAFAHEIDAEIRTIDSSQIMDMYVGNAGKNLSEVFENTLAASQDQPYVLFFDEFNALAGKEGFGSKSHIEVVELFKKHISNVVNDTDHNLVIAAATNSMVDRIDDAIVRSGRLEPILAPIPNDQERVDVWGSVLWNSMRSFQKAELFNDTIESIFIPYETDVNPHELAKETEGMTGADFCLLLERARKKHMLHAYKTGEYGKVSQADLMKEIQQFGR